jgi:hypothetical protein
MGCDIHAFGEVKVKGKWIGLGEITSTQRNYHLFTKLAGVRNYDNAKAPAPKGFPPEGISETTLLNWKSWEGDGHSVSYMDCQEILDIEKWMDEHKYKGSHNWQPYFGYLFGNGWGDHIKYPEDGLGGLPEGFEGARIIYWFDN